MQETAIDASGPQRAVIQVWIDFVCPYCLLGESIVAEATAGLDVDIAWMPFELRPYPTPTLRPEDDYLPAAWENGVYPAARRMGVDIRLPTVSPQPYSRQAFLGLQLAMQHGKADAYVDAVMRAFFQDDRDIGDTTVLKDILGRLGMPAEELDAVLASRSCNDRHDAALQFAREAGIRAVPSVAIGRRLFAGIPEAGELRATILAQIGTAAGSA